MRRRPAQRRDPFALPQRPEAAPPPRAFAVPLGGASASDSRPVAKGKRALIVEVLLGETNVPPAADWTGDLARQ